MDKQKHLDELFRQAKEQNPVVTFKETKERFLTAEQSNLVNPKGKKGSFLLTKKLIIMIVTVSTLIIALFLSNNQSENKPTSKISSNVPKEMKKNSEPIANSEGPLTDPSFRLFESLPNFIQIFPEAIQFSEAKSDTLKVKENMDFIKSNIPIFNDEYVFPKLTEEEIKANNKQKKLMMKSLEKYDKKVYAYIPTGTFDYQGKQVSVQSFYMQKTEVSNLEYRTFLFDILIQGRKDEFLKARPDYKQWSIQTNQSDKKMLEDHYFSDPAYNNFPVVNISREGAEMYCKWVTLELNKFVGVEKQNEYNDIRIPLRVEWVKAASVEGKQLPYPWGGNGIRNLDSMILANCVIGYRNDTLQYKSNPRFVVTAPVKSYWPNEYDIYNFAGNASEMVYEEINQVGPGTAGGNWMTYFEGVKILAPDEYEGVVSPKPTIGFRVVMTVKK